LTGVFFLFVIGFSIAALNFSIAKNVIRSSSTCLFYFFDGVFCMMKRYAVMFLIVGLVLCDPRFDLFLSNIGW